MKLLLDSHVLFWALGNSDKLCPEIHEAIRKEAEMVFVSVGSLWELYLKANLGKVSLVDNFREEVEISKFKLLQIEFPHLETYRNLPLNSKHRDPFDRLLVAQALCEGLTVVTRDEKLAQYGVPILKA